MTAARLWLQRGGLPAAALSHTRVSRRGRPRPPRSHGRPDPGDAAPPQVSSVPARVGLRGEAEEGCGSWAGVPASFLDRSYFSVPLLLEGRGEKRGEAKTRGLGDFGEKSRNSSKAREERQPGGRRGSGSQTKGVGAGCGKWLGFENSQFTNSQPCLGT